MIRRSATLTVELEAMDGLLAQGKKVDLDLYARLTGHLRRAYETLGIKRVAKDVTPSLDAYLAQKAAEREGSE